MKHRLRTPIETALREYLEHKSEQPLGSDQHRLLVIAAEAYEAGEITVWTYHLAEGLVRGRCKGMRPRDFQVELRETERFIQTATRDLARKFDPKVVELAKARARVPRGLPGAGLRHSRSIHGAIGPEGSD